MTSPASHPELKHATVWWLECTYCGLDAVGGKPLWFTTLEQLWEAMLDRSGHGWTRRDDGRVLCRHHSAVADCEISGHQICPWAEHPLDAGLEWRYCQRCGSSFEQRITSQGATARG
jgi:hypothetical protein